MNKVWSELNKIMQAQIKKKDTYEAGIATPVSYTHLALRLLQPLL